MHLYVHKLTVIVVTEECSPDVIERRIEAIGDVQTNVSATTDRDSRSRGPSITVPNPPAWPAGGDKREEADYFTALDTWRDAYFPRADSVEVRSKA